MAAWDKIERQTEDDIKVPMQLFTIIYMSVVVLYLPKQQKGALKK